MVGVVLEVLVVLFVLAGLVALYVWTQRTEADAIYEPRVKSEDEANSLRLGVALNTGTGNLGGH